MKKLKVEKAFIGKFISQFPDIFSKVTNTGVIGGDSATWSKDKMANLSKYASNSYGTGQKSTEQKMTTLSKGGMLRQGKPKIAMKGWK